MRLWLPFRWGCGVAVAPVAPPPSPDPLALALAAEQQDSVNRHWRRDDAFSMASWDGATPQPMAFARVEQVVASAWTALTKTPTVWSRV